ncbi:hypothetical protein [Neptuniibacter sp.]|nr:hypothetical protein [Neptuniibacter sp.]MCP4595099.1 hypothetical protein [Neptuniibacter sp.]
MLNVSLILQKPFLAAIFTGFGHYLITKALPEATVESSSTAGMVKE